MEKNYFIGHEIDVTDIVYEAPSGMQIFKKTLQNGDIRYGCAMNLLVTSVPVYTSIQVLSDNFFIGTNENEMEIKNVNGERFRNSLRTYEGTMRIYDEGIMDSPGDINKHFIDNQNNTTEYNKEIEAFHQSHVPIIMATFKRGGEVSFDGTLRFDTSEKAIEKAL